MDEPPHDDCSCVAEVISLRREVLRLRMAYINLYKQYLDIDQPPTWKGTTSSEPPGL